jgi:A/G-specific adenine glycosylase
MSPTSGLPSDFQTRAFRSQLLDWYDAHRRDLPWRANRDPYRVWVSEIMLQQTRVAAVIDHYQQFLRRFPTIEKLAAAGEASVLAAWSGLGYYRRARMLYAAAKVVVREYGGSFPETEAELRKLPGIGRYTAAAIASIAFDEPVAAVDGNVERVLQRVLGIPLMGGKTVALRGEKLWRAANSLLDPKRPGDFNQAMMELGATVCTPRAPMCMACPVIQFCRTRGELPTTGKPGRQKKREVWYALHRRNGSVLLVQRDKSESLMPGMWELPSSNDNLTEPLFTLRHSITVTDYIVRVCGGEVMPVSAKWIALERLPRLPLTGLARKILRKANLIGA